MTVMWWDAQSSLYRFRSVNTNGSSQSGTIAIAANLWTWTSTVGAQRFRTSNRWISPTKVEYVAEHSTDNGTTWQQSGAGTETREP